MPLSLNCRNALARPPVHVSRVPKQAMAACGDDPDRGTITLAEAASCLRRHTFGSDDAVFACKWFRIEVGSKPPPLSKGEAGDVVRVETKVDALSVHAPWQLLGRLVKMLPTNETLIFCRPNQRKPYFGRSERSHVCLCRLRGIDCYVYVSSLDSTALGEFVVALCKRWETGLTEAKGYKLSLRGFYPASQKGWVHAQTRTLGGRADGKTWLRSALEVPVPDDTFRFHVVGSGQDARLGNGDALLWKFMSDWGRDSALRVHGTCAVCVECTLASDDGLYLHCAAPLMQQLNVCKWPLMGLANIANVNGKNTNRGAVQRSYLFRVAKKLNWYSPTVMLFPKRQTPAHELALACRNGIASRRGLEVAVEKYVEAMDGAISLHRMTRVPLRLEQTVSMKEYVGAVETLAAAGLTISESHRRLSLELARAVWPAVVRVPASSLHAWVDADNHRASQTLSKIVSSDVPLLRNVAAVFGVACVQMYKHDGGFDRVALRYPQHLQRMLQGMIAMGFDPDEVMQSGQLSGWWEPQRDTLVALQHEALDAPAQALVGPNEHIAAPARGGEKRAALCRLAAHLTLSVPGWLLPSRRVEPVVDRGCPCMPCGGGSHGGWICASA